MPVVLVVSNLEHGGAQRQVVQLANALSRDRFDVRVCSLSSHVPLVRELRDADTRLQVIEKRRTFDLSVVTRLARFLRALQAGVVHGYLFDADVAARLAGRLARTPLIVASERNSDYRLKRRQWLAYRLTRGLVDLIIANSRAGASYHRRLCGHDASLYQVVHNGVDVERFAPTNGTALRRELGIEPDEDVVGMFASFKRQKNHPLFLAAARLVLRRRPRTRFIMVGDELHQGMHGSDEYKRRINRMVDDLDIRPRCLFCGNRDDLPRYYCACDLTVLPSLHEGTSNVLLESMACGVPVIATDVSDNPYIVPSGRAGYVVPLGDERLLADRICELLDNGAGRAEMGRSAREWVTQEFSIRSMARRTQEAYELAWSRKYGGRCSWRQDRGPAARPEATGGSVHTVQVPRR